MFNCRGVYHVVGPQGHHDNNEDWIVFHPFSLSVFEVDDLTGRVLRLYELGYETSAVSERLHVARQKCENLLVEFVDFVKEKEPNEIYVASEPDTLWFTVSGTCNMRCGYCYASQGSFGTSCTQLMPKLIAEKAVNAFFRNFKIEMVSFFGGEPLLNFEVIEKIVKLIDDLGYVPEYTISTNATLISKKIAKFFKEHNVRPTLSIDGPKFVHDYHRIFRDGSGSYGRVLRSVKMLRDENVKFAIEATFTKDAINMGYDMRYVADHLSAFSKVIILKPATSTPLLGMHTDCEIMDDPRGIKAMYDYIEYVFDRISTQDPLYDGAILQGSYALIQKIFKTYSCSQGRFITVCPDGSVYTCNMLTHPLFLLGNVRNNRLLGERFEEIRSLLFGWTHVDKILQPHWYAPFQDVCPAMSLTENLDGIPQTLQFPEKTHLYLSMVWDEFLRNFVKSKKDSPKWNRIRQNLNAYFRERKQWA